MAMRITAKLWRSVSVLALSATLHRASYAQEVEQIMPPSQGSVGTIGSAAGGNVAPIGAPSGAEKSVAPITSGTTADAPLFSGDSIAAAMTDTLLERLKTHTLTPAAAWESGALDVDVLLDILGHRLGPWGGFYWERDDDLRRALVKLLIEHGGAQLENTDKLAPALRLWLADYYWSVQDARAVPLAESILSEVKAPVKGENALLFSAVERIAWHYRDTGAAEKSAQTWLRIPVLMPSQGWWIPGSYAEAAKMYEQAGNLEKAEQIYAQAPITGIGWSDGLIVTNRAQMLIKQGRYEDARQVLHKGMTGPDNERIMPVMLASLGDSYYFAGDLKPAANYAQQAVDSYNALSASQHDIYLDAVLPINQERLRWIEKWANKLIICAPQHLNVTRLYIPSDVDATEITRRFYVRTLHRVPLRMVSDNPSVTARVVEDETQQPFKAHYYQQEVAVSIAPAAFETGAQAILTVSSPDIPNQQVQMPVLINKQNATTKTQ